MEGLWWCVSLLVSWWCLFDTHLFCSLLPGNTYMYIYMCVFPGRRGENKCVPNKHHQNNIYTPVTGVSSPVENRSCPESTCCWSKCVIPLSWCQSVFDEFVMAEWFRCWLYQSAARGVSKILGSPVQHWHIPHEAIRSQLVFTLLTLHGGMLSSFHHT